MLNIFRKIRRTLIEFGPTGQPNSPVMRYLLYAIGEVFLVVIGILLAVQVNNWNERRNTDDTIRRALLNLKGDLKNDIIYLKNLDSIYTDWNLQALDIQEKLRSNSIKRINSMDEYLVGRGSMNHLSIRRTTVDEMINTGILYKINNPPISESINEYYEFAKSEIEKVNSDNQEFYRYVLNTSGYYYINLLTRLDSRANLDYIDWSWLQDPRSERYKIFEARLAFHMRAIEANKLLIGQLERKAENVLAVIK